MRIFPLFFLLFPTLAAAQGFDAGIGARAGGMGGAFVAVADDATGVYWNPAGLATGATFDLQVAKGRESGLFIGAALPVLGMAYYRAHTVVAGLDRENGGSGGVPPGRLETSNYGVTVVQTIVNGLVIGTTTRLVRGGFESQPTRTTIDLDFGAMATAGPIRFGVTGRNLRQPAFEDAGGELRQLRHFRAGVAIAPRSLPSGVHGPFTVAFDADLTTLGEWPEAGRGASAGGEYWLGGGRLGLRAGLAWNTRRAGQALASFGFTAGLPRSIFVEGRMTEAPENGERDWTVGVRTTF
jgi:hypothetical protein